MLFWALFVKHCFSIFFKKFVNFLLCAVLKIYGKDHFRVDPITPSYDRITKKLWSHIVKHIFFLICEVSFKNVSMIASIRYYKIFQSKKLSLTGFEAPSAHNLNCQLLFLVSKALEFIKILCSTFLIKILFIKQIFKVKHAKSRRCFYHFSSS